MSQYKVHVYIVREDFYEPNREIYVWRENLATGERQLLRSGEINWPESIVKTCVQVDVPANLYDITRGQLKRDAWDEATLIPETEW